MSAPRSQSHRSAGRNLRAGRRRLDRQSRRGTPPSRGDRAARNDRSPSGSEASGDIPPAQAERLQKVLAAAGSGSRRQCEELITTGRVEVNRRVVTELGVRVEPLGDDIRVDGESLPKPKLTYYAVNKPIGVLCTSRDPSGRPRVIDMLPEAGVRLFAVGRLDMHSDGLILLTNDGELANQLTHPRFGIAKTYRVLVAGEPTREQLATLRRGVHLAEGLARVERVEIKSRRGKSTMLEMVLREGRNREIRRILARCGHKVLKLTRTAVGPVHLGQMPVGASRRLTHDEVRALRRAVRERRP